MSTIWDPPSAGSTTGAPGSSAVIGEFVTVNRDLVIQTVRLRVEPTDGLTMSCLYSYYRLGQESTNQARDLIRAPQHHEQAPRPGFDLATDCRDLVPVVHRRDRGFRPGRRQAVRQTNSPWWLHAHARWPSVSPHATPMPAARLSFPVLLVGASDETSAVARSVGEIAALGRRASSRRLAHRRRRGWSARTGCRAWCWRGASRAATRRSADPAHPGTCARVRSFRSARLQPRATVGCRSRSSSRSGAPSGCPRTAGVIAGRIDAAARRYLNTILPPFFRPARRTSPTPTRTRGTRPATPAVRRS